MRPGRILLAAILIPASLHACTTDASPGPRTPDATAPALDPSTLPIATLHTAAGDLAGAPGTRCWASACIDMIGPITPPAPAPVTLGETLSLDFDHGPPSEVISTWMSVPGPAPTPTASGLVAWSGLFPPLGSAAATGLDAPVTPGGYVLIVAAFWHGEGDVSYGFYLEVE